MYLDDALDQIAAIRGQMARAGVYRGFRASAALGSAMAAVAVAAAQSAVVPDPGRHPYAYLDLWCGTAVACGSAVAAGVYARYRRTASPTQRALARSAAGQFAPCLVVGGLLTTAMSECAPAALWLLPGLWAMLFGLGVLATRPLLPRGTGVVGLFYVVAGVGGISLSQTVGRFSPWLMAVPFGVGQAAAAFVLYWNLERSPAPTAGGEDE